MECSASFKEIPDNENKGKSGSLSLKEFLTKKKRLPSRTASKSFLTKKKEAALSDSLKQSLDFRLEEETESESHGTGALE